MSDLTTADRFELEHAAKIETICDEKVTHDYTDNTEINRWDKEGDRLYLNNVSSGDVYVNLETGDIEGDLSSRKCDLERDGDTLTVTLSHSKDYEIVIRAVGLDTDEDEDNDAEPEVACDGGEDTTSHVTDDEIEAAIEQHDDTDHDATYTVDDVRDVLAEIQADNAAYLQEFFDADTLVYADDSMYVFADAGGQELNEALAALDVDTSTTDGDILRSIVASVYRRVADRVTDYHWTSTSPIVIGRTGPEAALSREEAGLSADAVLRRLAALGLSPAEALDYWLVEVQDYTATQIATERGTTHQAVSKNVRQAREKLR